jgi:putative transposase
MSIESLDGKIMQKDILAVAGISRQAYHAYFKRSVTTTQRDTEIVTRVVEARSLLAYRKMGARPLYYALKIEGVGINKFEQLLSTNGFNVSVRKNPRITTDGSRWINDVNLVRGLNITDINQVILGDITYWGFKGKFYYVFTLKDAYSKRIVGLYGSDTLEAKNAIKCLSQVICLRGKTVLKDCIHHSDAGSQYKSKSYRAKAKYLRWSIAANCLENGMAEQLNFILKNHYLEDEEVKTVTQLNGLLRKIKKIMNEKRPVKFLGYKTPTDFEEFIKGIPTEQRPKFKFSEWGEPIGEGDFGEA